MSELFPETIETDRLRLEKLDRESIDVFELYELFSSSDSASDSSSTSSDRDLESVLRYVPLDPHETPKDALEMAEHATERADDGEGVTYAIRPLEGEEGAGPLAGTASVFLEWERRSAEFAIVLRERFWGRGYSGERAEALFELAFDRLDLELVAISCLPENERSKRAIETYVEAHGGRYDGLFRNVRTIDDEPADTHRFTVSSDQYANSLHP